MAKAPESIQLIWKRLEDRKVRIPSAVWELWEPYLKKIDEIGALAASGSGGPVSVDQVLEIAKRVDDIRRFIRSIKPDPAGRSRVEDGRILLDCDALELVVHYIGNDLYVIAMVADVPENNPRPLPVGDVSYIIANVGTIREFVARLKKQTA